MPGTGPRYFLCLSSRGCNSKPRFRCSCEAGMAEWPALAPPCTLNWDPAFGQASPEDWTRITPREPKKPLVQEYVLNHIRTPQLRNIMLHPV